MDGDDWVQVHSDYGFAFEPIFVERAEGMVEKSIGFNDDQIEVLAWPTQLHPAVPNPFNPSTTLKFSLDSESQVDISVYNVKGERVQQLITGIYSMGDHSVILNGKNEQGQSVASGVYFARMASGSIAQTQRLVLVQ